MLLAVGCRDNRPLVDSGSVVSTCPVDYATSVPSGKVNCSMNLESVLGESTQHCVVKRNVRLANRKGGTMSVNFEVTVTQRAVLCVHKGLWLRLYDRVHSRWKRQNHQRQEMY